MDKYDITLQIVAAYATLDSVIYITIVNQWRAKCCTSANFRFRCRSRCQTPHFSSLSYSKNKKQIKYISLYFSYNFLSLLDFEVYTSSQYTLYNALHHLDCSKLLKRLSCTFISPISQQDLSVFTLSFSTHVLLHEVSAKC